jgi:hypothetical protein
MIKRLGQQVSLLDYLFCTLTALVPEQCFAPVSQLLGHARIISKKVFNACLYSKNCLLINQDDDIFLAAIATRTSFIFST